MMVKGSRPSWRTYHTVVHPEQYKINWKAFYEKADELTAEARTKLVCHADVMYGEDPKQGLDIYLPKGNPSGCPVFFFLHGGGFREGDRLDYGFVASPFANHGIVTVSAGYRLTPEFRYPHAHDDGRSALAWVFHHIKEYGGDPDRIYVGGHSSGANIAAYITVRGDWLKGMGLPSNLIKGLASVSTSYDLRKVSWVGEYLPDPEQRGEASPILNLQTTPPYAVIGVGSLEQQAGKERVQSSKEFVQKLKEKGGAAELVLLEDMEHDQTALEMGDEQSPLFRAILRMIRPA
jgi:acetyl esterase/lipase